MEGSDRNVIQAIVSVNPGLAFIKFWQGIVEISLRGLAIALAFILLIAAAATEGRYKKYRPFYERCNTQDCNNLRNGPPFMIALSLFVIIMEGLIIIARFLNFTFINAFIKTAICLDICKSILFSLCLLIGGVVLAALVNSDLAKYLSLPRQPLRATVAFSFILIFELIGLVIWMVIYLVMKWNNKLMEHTTRNKDEEN